MIISIPFKVYEKIDTKSMKKSLDNFINHDTPEVLYNDKRIGFIKSAEYMKSSKECILLNIELCDDGCINNVKEMLDDVNGDVQYLEPNIYYIASFKGKYFVPYKIKTIHLNIKHNTLNNTTRQPAYMIGDDINNGV